MTVPNRLPRKGLVVQYVRPDGTAVPSVILDIKPDSPAILLKTTTDLWDLDPTKVKTARQDQEGKAPGTWHWGTP